MRRSPLPLVIAVIVGSTQGSAAAAEAVCPSTSTSEELVAHASAAVEAYGNTDAERFLAEVDLVRLALPCLDAPIGPHAAAQVHLVQGLRLFVERAPDRALEAFRATRSIGAGEGFPAGLVPDGHPLMVHFETASPSAAAPTLLPEPDGVQVWIDGQSTLARPQGQASIVQVADSEGHVSSTRYLFSADELPAWPVKAAPVVETAPPARTNRQGLRWGLAIAGGATLVAAGVELGIGLSAADRFDANAPGETRPELEALQGRANAFATGGLITSGAAALMGLGLGLTFVL